MPKSAQAAPKGDKSPNVEVSSPSQSPTDAKRAKSAGRGRCWLLCFGVQCCLLGAIAGAAGTIGLLVLAPNMMESAFQAAGVQLRASNLKAQICSAAGAAQVAPSCPATTTPAPCPACPKKECPACPEPPACPTCPASGDDECQMQLKQLRESMEAKSSSRHHASIDSSVQVAGELWPNCIQKDVALRDLGKHALYEDVSALLGDAATGCWMGKCTFTDRFVTKRPEDCAHVCGALPRCAFWSLGSQDGVSHCFLRLSDEGREHAKGFEAAGKECAPAHTVVPAKQAALSVLDSAPLRACDAGAVGPSCPNLKDAMRTWQYAIQQAQTTLEGMSHNAGDLVDQIAADAESVLSADEKAADFGDVYSIAAANSRQVLEALRAWLSQDDRVDISPLDASVPRPARGLICLGSCV
eukprot:gnl/TRDRNA2_/TRDRNA2_151511_c0_seq2.p1 gnl/TRDRNA2_/TRDRNA2_151511_c0~~gnl/TRDRNA2_/TRDRNA2_151511_c0_seq2.p1  ORF type:complete len:412 (+),score=73.11 gnl/TRDRNA2_/TRDRNA2_151511_c0_seq2:127-1362(+)